MSRTLLIDNYDSYTYLIYQKIWEISGIQPLLIKNDALQVEQLQALDFQNIVLSPGPGTPTQNKNIGISSEVLAAFPEVPVLGVCLGHQLLGHFFGANIQEASQPMHGRYSTVELGDSPLFANMPRHIEVVRYHSLIVARESIPPMLRIIARTTADDQIMGLQHREKPWYGVQFHPESIGTEFGDRIFTNFLQISDRWSQHRTSQSKGVQLVFRKEVLSWKDPEAVFAHLFQTQPNSFWLDSSSSGHNSRYSYMGVGEPCKKTEEDLFFELEQKLIYTDLCPTEDPLPFKGGWVGVLAYENTHHLPLRIERNQGKPTSSQFLWTDHFLAFDHHLQQICLCSALSDEKLHTDWVSETEKKLSACPLLAELELSKLLVPSEEEQLTFQLKRSKKEYLEDIEAIQALIRQGESYEVCLTNEFSALLELNPFYLYRVLRKTNPAPFAAYFHLGDHHVLSSSPENFFQLDKQRNISSEPIKGTRPLGKEALETEKLRQELLHSTKDHAELLMIIDLIRNDLSMICERGTVKVPELVQIREYATVLQASSLITGKLRAEISPLQALKSIFPGGSITGAPKLRTMEIIHQMEQRERGAYTGSIGFLSLDQTASFNIAIRTMVYEAEPKRLSFGSGGAVLFDSDPEAEFEEIMVKAFALIRAANLALNGVFGSLKLEERKMADSFSR